MTDKDQYPAYRCWWYTDTDSRASPATWTWTCQCVQPEAVVVKRIDFTGTLGGPWNLFLRCNVAHRERFLRILKGIAEMTDASGQPEQGSFADKLMKWLRMCYNIIDDCAFMPSSVGILSRMDGEALRMALARSETAAANLTATYQLSQGSHYHW
jgi:hypothetical protein